MAFVPTIPTAIYVSHTPVDKVYQGGNQVWPYVPPPSGTYLGRWRWAGEGNLNTLAGTFEQAGATAGATSLGFNRRDADGIDLPGNAAFTPGEYEYGGVPFTGLALPQMNGSGPSGNGYLRYNNGVQADLTAFQAGIGALVVGTTYDLWRVSDA